MSLIFEALKKLQDPPGPGKAWYCPSTGGWSGYARHGNFKPLWRVTVAGLGLMLAGFGVLYGLNAVDQTRGVIAADASVPVITLSPASSSPGPHPNEPCFMPAANDRPKTERAVFIPAGVQESGRSASSKPQQKKSGRDLGHSNRLRPFEDVSMENGTAVRAGVFPVKSTEDQVRTERLPATLPRADTAFSDQGSPSEDPHRREDPQTALPAKIAKQAEIARLVTRIHAGMDRGEHQLVQDLMMQLAALKGPENAYVLKMKAYWHLRNEEYPAAVTLLDRVLAQDADDLEAGINMAIAEIKTHQYQAARRRLGKLRETYPDNSKLAELIAKLR